MYLSICASWAIWHRKEVAGRHRGGRGINSIMIYKYQHPVIRGLWSKYNWNADMCSRSDSKKKHQHHVVVPVCVMQSADNRHWVMGCELPALDAQYADEAHWRCSWVKLKGSLNDAVRQKALDIVDFHTRRFSPVTTEVKACSKIHRVGCRHD